MARVGVVRIIPGTIIVALVVDVITIVSITAAAWGNNQFSGRIGISESFYLVDVGLAYD